MVYTHKIDFMYLNYKKNKPFLMFCIIFLIFGKKSIICAEDVILREKNFHGKKCYNMCLKRFLCVADLILI